MSTPDRFVAGALDLSALQQPATATSRPTQAQHSGGEVPVSVVITMDNVEREVLRRSSEVPVIVLIGTPRSPHSEPLRTELTRLAEASNKQFILAYIDADQTPDVAQMFGVQHLPTVVAIAAGRPLANFEGAQPPEALKQWTDAVVKAVEGQLTGLVAQEEQEPPADPRLDAATDALNAGDFERALAVYDEILAQEPKNTEVQQAKESAKLLQRLAANDAAADVVAAADADPSDIEKAFAAADFSITAGAPEEAFSRLLALLKNTAGDEQATVRSRLLELFGLYGAHDPRVLAARQQLASALF